MLAAVLAAESVDLIAVYGPAAVPVLGLVAAVKWLTTELRTAREEAKEAHALTLTIMREVLPLQSQTTEVLNRAADALAAKVGGGGGA